MSAPYLNRGETIILTTHRVSVGSVEYDALLTTGRLILMDRHYTRFEPKMILFPAIVTVKAGKGPAGEPAIILTLNAQSDLTGSEQLNIIFLQEPGENRRSEREQWVRQLIGLVISAREQVIQEPASVTREKTAGMNPSVRRWVAPEPPLPHTSLEQPAPPVPEPVVIAEGPDPMEFFLETRNATDRKVLMETEVEPPQEIMSEPVIPDEVSQEPEPESPPIPWPVIVPVTVPMTEAADPVPVWLPEKEEPIISDSHAAESLTSDAFSRIVASVAESLHVKLEESPPVILQKEPVVAEVPEPVPTVVEDQLPLEVPVTLPAVAPEEPVISEPESEPVPVTPAEPATSPAPAAPGTRRELPGTYTPKIPVTFTRHTTGSTGEDGTQAGSQGSRKILVIAGILVILVLVILGSVMLFSHPPISQNNPPLTTITPDITAVPTIDPASAAASTAGIQVRVDYPGQFSGTAGNPGYLHPVSGTGPRIFPIRMLTNNVQATIQKQDNSGDVMTVGIYNNNTLLTQKTITAPMGEIDILIDVTTELPPGLEGTTPSQGSAGLLGNGSLIYY